MGLRQAIGRWLLGDVPMVAKDVSDASIGSGNFTQGVPAFWFARAVEHGGGSERLTSPYEKSVWVQRAIKKIAGPIAGVDVQFSDLGTLETKRNRGKGALKRAYTPRGQFWRTSEDFIELPAISDWLRHPMKGLSYSDFVEASIGWLKMQECFWLLGDDMLKPFPEVAKSYPPVVIARPDMMRAVVEGGELLGWVFTQPGGKQYQLLPDQVIQLRYWNPYSEFRGLGEYPSAHLAAESDYLAGKFSRNLMANNGDLGGVIIAKNGVPTDEQREQIIMDLRAKRQAQLRGDLRYTFMTGDIDIKDPKITSVDAPFITQRLENRHEIALAFGVPPSMFDVKAAFSIGSASDYYQLITDTCIPTGAKFCDALEMLIFKMTGQRIEVSLNWDGHPVMQAVLRELFESVDKLWSKGMPMKTIGEYLGMNLPRFDGDDVGFVAINVTPIEQATEPEPPPAENPALAEGPPGTAESEESDAVKEMVRALRMRKPKTHQLWEKHMRLRSGTVRAYSSKVRRVLNEFRGQVLKRIESAGLGARAAGVTTKSTVDLIFNAEEFGRQLVLSVNLVAQMAIDTATGQLFSEIGREDDPWKMPPSKVKELIHSRDQSIKGCGDTVRSQLNTALDEGYQAGESTADLMDRVRGVFNNLTKFEAERIARTETAIVFNTARRAAGEAAGVKYHTWLSSHGPNVRPAHAEAEDRYIDDPIPLDEPFEVGGEYLSYPGDPSGSPENIINCQCVELMREAPGDDDE